MTPIRPVEKMGEVYVQHPAKISRVAIRPAEMLDEDSEREIEDVLMALAALQDGIILGVLLQRKIYTIQKSIVHYVKI